MPAGVRVGASTEALTLGLPTRNYRAAIRCRAGGLSGPAHGRSHRRPVKPSGGAPPDLVDVSVARGSDDVLVAAGVAEGVDYRFQVRDRGEVVVPEGNAIPWGPEELSQGAVRGRYDEVLLVIG